MPGHDTVPLRTRTAEEVLGLTGRTLGPSPWLEVDQDRVDAFATAVEDWHWAHNAPELASRGPFGGPIVHAHLTLTLIVHLLSTVLVVDEGTLMFYGLNRVRFPDAVPVGSRIRLDGQVAEVRDLGGAEQLTLDLRVAIEHRERPACVAQSIWRHYWIGAPG